VYYANSEAGRLWGPDMAEQAANGAALEVFQAYVQDGGPQYPIRDTAHATALRGERAHFDDMELRLQDGTIALEVWGTPIYDRAGAVEFTVAAFADISDRRAAERALSDQASLLDLAHDAIFVWDARHVITFWNRGAERTYGFTRAEAVGCIATDLLHTEYPRPGSDLEAELDASGSWQGELVQTRKDGKRIVLASRWAGRRGPDGSRIATMEVNRDITAAKNAERYARSLIEASQDPLVTVSPEGKITDFNQATIRGTGAQREEIIGTDFAWTARSAMWSPMRRSTGTPAAPCWGSWRRRTTSPTASGPKRNGRAAPRSWKRRMSPWLDPTPNSSSSPMSPPTIFRSHCGRFPVRCR
jgi:PAS domain S-box-containing protein